MAIIYVDKWETTLTGSVTTGAALLPVAADKAAAVQAALAMYSGFSALEAKNVGAAFVRVPLFVDNGSAVELVEATYGDATGLTVVRGAAAVAWAAGTSIRCAPPAGRVAEGHEAVRAVSGAAAFAVPGECVAWAPTGAYLTLKLPASYSWPAAQQAFAGECWPARVVIKNGLTARSVMLMNPTADGVNNVYFGDGLKSMLALPDTAEWAVLTITKLPLPVRSAGAPQFVGRLELF